MVPIISAAWLAVTSIPLMEPEAIKFCRPVTPKNSAAPMVKM